MGIGRLATTMNGSHFMQQLQDLTHTPEGSLPLKSEDENDYPAPGFDFQQYYQTSPTDFPNMLNSVTCSPNNPVLSNPLGIQSKGGYPRLNFPQRHMGPNAMPHSYMEQQLPDTTNFPGMFNFELSLGPHTDSATKSADYTFSTILKKLYVQKGAHCPFKLKTSHEPPPNSYIKVLPVYKGTHVLSEPVRRCSNHAEGDDEGDQRYHFIRANHSQTQYIITESGRLYLTIPYTGPQVGAEFQTELLSFMCFNSCGHSSHAKRRIDVIFTLEHQGQVLGRQVIEVRVCACPGRDRTNEEQANAPRTGGKTARRGSLACAPRGGKRRKLSSATDDVEYTLTTNNPAVFKILSEVQNLIETSMLSLPTDILHARSTNSPSSNASSPSGHVFKQNLIPGMETPIEES